MSLPPVPPPPQSEAEDDLVPLGGKTQEEEDGNIFSHYYGQLSHQQNMLQDAIRTTTYQQAIFQNSTDFQGAKVVDVGTGSGILSFFSAQAGASKVYGIEMSRIALAAKKLMDANGMKDKIEIVKGKVEEVELPGCPKDEKCIDILVSEPLGFLLVHERMLESYIVARDRWLKPGGKMFPTCSTIFTAPFTDKMLYEEQRSKADFWDYNDFYGLDLRCLKSAALEEHFSMPVVGYFNPDCLLSNTTSDKFFDFRTCSLKELQTFEIDLNFVVEKTEVCHGIACWFDCDFIGGMGKTVLATGPDKPGTHWYQCRLLFQKPLAVNEGQLITGKLKFQANLKFSYDVDVCCREGCDDGSGGEGSCGGGVETRNMVYLQDQHYHYLTNQSSAVDAQGYGHAVGNDVQVTKENGYNIG